MFSQIICRMDSGGELDFFRGIAEEARDIILAFATDGKICYANQAASVAYGYSRSELYALRIHDLRDPATIGDIELQLAEARAGDAQFRTVHKRRCGGLFPVEVSSKMMPTAAGELYVSVIRDISEIRRAEEVLRSASEFGHGIMEGLDIPFFAVDHTFRYFVFNQAHVRAMKAHYGVDIQAGTSILSYYSGAALEQVRQNLGLALSGQPFVVEALVGDAKLEQKYLRIEHYPVRDSSGFIIGVAVFCTDISEQGKAQDAAQACDLRYRALVEDAQVIIMALSPSGAIGYLNEYGLKFFDFAWTAIQNRPVWELLAPEQKFGGRDLLALYEARWAAATEGFRETRETRTAGGKRIWVDWTVRRGVNPQTGEACWLCVGVDVTAKHRLQEEERSGYQRRRCNELLQDIIAGRLAEGQVQQSAAQLRLNLTGPFVCLVLALKLAAATANDDVKRRQAVEDVIDGLKQHSDGIVWEANDGIGLLLPCNGTAGAVTVAAAKTRVAGIVKKFGQYGLGELAAVGVACQSPLAVSIPQLYEQASTALAFGPFQQPKELIHFWHELGWVRLLAKDMDSPAAQQYIADTLGPLLQIASQEKSRVLLATLRELLAGEMFDVISERLDVHPQTVRYRKRVIENLLNVKLEAEETRTNLAIALKMYDVQQMRRTEGGKKTTQ